MKVANDLDCNPSPPARPARGFFMDQKDGKMKESSVTESI